MEIERLRYIGYWHSLESPDLPDPAWFVDPAWDEREKKRVLRYFRKCFQTPWFFMGSSWCRFRCRRGALGYREYTDGKFVWPEGLPHYIEHHRVRLPQEVSDHILAVRLPAKVQWNDSLKESIDMSWWLAQKGWNRDSKSFKALTNLSFGVLTIYQLDSSKVFEQDIVLREFLFKAQGFPYRLRQVKRILAGEQVTLTGLFIDYESFIEKASSVYLHSELIEMTFDEYHNCR
jgi:hypothetical protein